MYQIKHLINTIIADNTIKNYTMTSLQTKIITITPVLKTCQC